MLSHMRKPLYVRLLSDHEQATLHKGLRSSDAFVVHRCQILLASSAGHLAQQIADQLLCDDETVRRAIKAFNTLGLAALHPRSSRPKHTRDCFTEQGRSRLAQIVRQSPRTFGKESSVWTLDVLAAVAFTEGLTTTLVSDETIRSALKRLGIAWRRQASHQLSRTSLPPKKRRRDHLIALARGHPDWVVGFQDETWWSRLAQPNLHSFSTADAPLQLEQKQRAKDDCEPKALACYGVMLRGHASTTDRLWLRFVYGRPLSTLTIQFLAWGSAKLAAEGKTVWVLIWDNATWHTSKEVRTRVRTHNRQVKAGQICGARIVMCFLPSRSPWLNPIEPKWMHGKRRVLEASLVLGADEIEQRVCARECPREPHLAISASVS